MKWKEVNHLLNGFGVTVIFEKEGKTYRYDGTVDCKDRYVVPALRNPLTNGFIEPPHSALVIVHTPVVKALVWE